MELFQKKIINNFPRWICIVQSNIEHQLVDIKPIMCSKSLPIDHIEEVLPNFVESSVYPSETSTKDEHVCILLTSFLYNDDAQDNQSLRGLLLTPLQNKDSLEAKLNRITNVKPLSMESAPILPECRQEDDAVDFILGCSNIFPDNDDTKVWEEEKYCLSDESNQSDDIIMNSN